MGAWCGGLRPPLFVSLVLACVWVLGSASSARAAACDQMTTECHLFGSTSPTFTPAGQTFTSGPLTLGAEFSTNAAVEIVAVRWYRATTTQARPDKYTIWTTGGTPARVQWGTSGFSDWNDIVDDGLVGWQRTPIPSGSRPQLSAATYRASWLYPGTNQYTRQNGYSPVADGPLSFLGTYFSAGDVYPASTQASYYGLDIEVRGIGSSATATPTPLPTATATPVPTATPNPWAGFPTPPPYPTFPPYPTAVPMPTPVDYTPLFHDQRVALEKIAWEVGHLPERFFQGLWWAFIPDQAWLQENYAELLTEFNARFPFLGQVGEMVGGFQAHSWASECTSGTGVTWVTPWTTGGGDPVTIPPPLFFTWWCPWRTVAGVLILLAASVKAANDFYRELQPQ